MGFGCWMYVVYSTVTARVMMTRDDSYVKQPVQNVRSYFTRELLQPRSCTQIYRTEVFSYYIEHFIYIYVGYNMYLYRMRAY